MCVSACVCTCMHVCVCVCVCTWAHMHACVYACMCVSVCVITLPRLFSFFLLLSKIKLQLYAYRQRYYIHHCTNSHKLHLKTKQNSFGDISWTRYNHHNHFTYTTASSTNIPHRCGIFSNIHDTKPFRLHKSKDQNSFQTLVTKRTHLHSKLSW